MKLTPKNWQEFQHYKDRKPAWIKLHKGLLDDYQFHCLPLASKALAPCLWLLASEYEGGEIDASADEIAFRCHVSRPDLDAAVKPLIDAGFFVASDMLAKRKQDAIPEKERETEIQVEREIKYGADAPDSRAELWKRGLATLRQLTGSPESTCRKLIGRWLSQCHDQAIVVLSAIDEAARSPPIDPVSWISAHFKKRGTDGQATGNKLANALDKLGEHIREIDRGEEGGQAPPRLLSHG